MKVNLMFAYHLLVLWNIMWGQVGSHFISVGSFLSVVKYIVPLLVQVRGIDIAI